MIRRLSSFPGSISIAAICALFTVIFPKVSTTPQAPNQTVAIAQSERPRIARPISFIEGTIKGVPIRLATIELTDPKTFISIGLANQATQANSARSTRGDEAFQAMVHRNKAALTINGTFFSMDNQKRVMGNMVAGGRFLKFSPWENYGTTLGIRRGNRPEMITARTEGKPQWKQHWFSLTAGPRLLRQGKIAINPQQEGFTDPAVSGVAVRSAIGFPKDTNRLYLVTFHQPITLEKEAAIMRSIGAYEAMNLDGGTSVALAVGDRIMQSPGRELTNVITVYDSRFSAPEDLKRSWYEFQQNNQVALQPGK
ncbi:phosphodiester glycosidase family protein [Cyanobacteria bacterium FACHB-63]|nr:phosphodiester glycosidase family protein [Cyanobacteria bacterium FACHB-63]